MTCGARVEPEAIAERARKLTRAMPKIEAKARDAKAGAEASAATRELEAEKRSLAKVSGADLENARRRVREAEKIAEIERRLADMPSTAEPPRGKAVGSRLEDVRRRLGEARSAANARETLAGLGFRDRREAEREAEALERENLDALSDEWRRKTSALDVKARLERDLERMDAQRAKLQVRAKRISALAALDAAWSSKGLKRMAVAELAERVEDSMNRHAPLVFGKSRFRLEVTDGDFKVSRKTERGTFDVRSLSGSESRCFSVLCLLGMLPLLPAARRCNVLVMDEPDSHMDDKLKDAFWSHLLPAVTEVVPHVIAITNDDIAAGDRTVWIESDGKTSAARTES